jgi:hypothetical protein
MPAGQREADMDWDLAIRRNREALQRILAALFALVGLPESGPAPVLQSAVLQRHLHPHTRRILRAVESAIRRLVVIAAREIEVQPRTAGEGPDLAFLRNKSKQEPAEAGAPAALRIPAFPLLDPLKRYSFKPPKRYSKSFRNGTLLDFTRVRDSSRLGALRECANEHHRGFPVVPDAGTGSRIS